MLSRLALFVTLALALGLQPAAAASFDCTRAATAMERTICGDPELSRLDEVLAIAYATATGGLSDGAKEEMRQGQRSWLSFLERSCTDDAEPFPAPVTSEEGLQCLRAEYNVRFSWLEQSRMLSGLRFYPYQRYAAYRDPDADPESSWKVANKSLSTPRIDGIDAEANAFNSFVAERSGQFGDVLGVVGGKISEDAASEDIILDISVVRVLPGRITLMVDWYGYGHGAAHGNYTITYLHFLRGANRGLVPEDIFTGEGWREALWKLTVAAIKREHDRASIFGDLEGIRPTIANPEAWSFDNEIEDGLTIQFQPYEITAYAYGAPTVTIPWEALADYLAEDFRKVVYGG